MSSSSQRIFSGVAWTVVLNIVNAVYGFVSVPLLINYFGKAEYGLIGLAMSINVYMQLMDMGLNSTNVRFFSNWLAKRENEKVKSGFSVSLLFYGTIGIINAAILLIVAYFSNSIFNLTPEQNVIFKHLFYILAVSAIVSWYSSSFDQLISATENVGWIKKRSFIPKSIQILVLILTLVLHLNIETYFLLTTFGLFAIIPLSIKKIKKLLPFISFKPRWNKAQFKEILPYSLNIFSFSIFQFSFWNLRPIFLGMQGSPEMVADFKVMNGIIAIITMVSGSFLGALLPSSSKVVANKDKQKYYQIAYDGVKYVSIIVCLLVFGLITIAPDLLTLYVGKSYLYLVPWLSLWALLELTAHIEPISSLILAGSNIRPLSISSIIASVTGLIVTWFTIPHFHVGGAILGELAYSAVQQVFYYTYYWPHILKIDSLRVLTRSFGPYVIIGLIAFGITYITPSIHSTLGNFFLSGIEFTIIYLLISALSLNKDDKAFILKIVKRK